MKWELNKSFLKFNSILSNKRHLFNKRVDGEGVIEKAIEALKKGEFIFIYDGDGREEETDIVVASQFITPEKIKFMRKEGGGLICATIPHEYAEKIGLPYLHDIFNRSGYEIFKYLTPKVRYDAYPSFSVTINHRDNYTGIPDNERAKTIKEFAKFIAEVESMDSPMIEFGRRFISPGHVHLLISSGLDRRRGHTELSTALMVMAGLIPSATIVEILGEDGRSMGKNDAREFARRKGIIFLEGSDILDAWSKWYG